MINFYPENSEKGAYKWSWVWYHGVLESLSRKAGAEIADTVRADISVSVLSDGIHAGIFHGETEEPCLLFCYTLGNIKRGLVVSIADIKAIQYAFECYTQSRLII